MTSCTKLPLCQSLLTPSMSDYSADRWVSHACRVVCNMSIYVQAGLQFLLDYPLGKKLNRFLDFHLINLR